MSAKRSKSCVTAKQSRSSVTAERSTRRYDAWQPAARCAIKFSFGWQSSGTYCSPKHARFHRGVLIRKPKTPPRLFRLQMAQRHGQRVGSVRRFRCLVHREQSSHHQLHLPLVGMTVTGHGSLHFARCITVDHHAVLGRRSERHNEACGTGARHSQQFRSRSAPRLRGPHPGRACSHSCCSMCLRKSSRAWHQVYGQPHTPANLL